MKNLISFCYALLSLTLIYNCSPELEESQRTAPNQYTLTVTAGEGGSVTPEATGTYDEGTTITLSATPDAEYDFDRWLGSDFDNSGCGFARYCRTAVTMNSDRDVQAFFQSNSR